MRITWDKNEGNNNKRKNGKKKNDISARKKEVK